MARYLHGPREASGDDSQGREGGGLRMITLTNRAAPRDHPIADRAVRPFPPPDFVVKRHHD